ncbi:MAG: T9SS type A sorting domain-containing protein [Deferribacteres bacterium]|nr:T9SS type A sorting domain-containing protein [Deferribacteres bacterium]
MKIACKYLAILKLFVFVAGYSQDIFAQVDYWQPIRGLEGVPISAIAVNAQGDIFVGADSGRIYRKLVGDDFRSVGDLPKFGGAISQISISSVGELFARYAGIHFSKDNGESWVPLSTGGMPLMGNFAIDSSSSIFVGVRGNGVYRSQDNGQTWDSLCCTDRFALYINATANGSLFVATNCCTNAGTWTGKIFRSTTSGESWTKVYEDPWYLPIGSYVSVVRANEKGDVVANATAGIVYSHDNGDTWKKIERENLRYSSRKIVIDSRGDLFLGTEEDGVFRYSFADTSWHEINNGLTDLRIRNISLDRNDYLYVGTVDDGLFRSVKRTTSVNLSAGSAPDDFLLEQNYPNPFNAGTTIPFSLSNAGFVTLKVYTLLGEEVATLAAGQFVAGEHQIKWQAEEMASGVYLYQIRMGQHSHTRKMIVLQ